MQVPTIHLNGTSKKELLEQLQTACSAVRDARHALSLAAPHGRDYYPQGGDAFAKAQGEHEARATALRTIEAELCTLMEKVDEQ